MAMKKIFCFFVILAILMSAMPISIFGMENNITNARLMNDASLGTPGFSNSTAVGAEIEQLASSLDYDPVKLFYYVRNNVDYEPYLGVMAGPNWTLLQGAGNSFDQALLLSSLLRESGIQTRYVYGEIEVSADDAAKWLRSENATQAANFLASSGIPTTCWIEGYSGDVVSVLKNEHMWIEAKLSSESDWIPLDPSFKLYEYVAGLESPLLNLTSTSNLLNETINTSEYDKTQGWVTSVNGTFAVEKMDEYANDIFNLILSDSELQNRTFTQVVIPEEYYHKARFKLGTIDYSTLTSEIAGKRITIHFVPATEEDRDYIEQAGGIFEGTPDRVNMKPVLFTEGKSVAEGTPLTLGEQITLSTEFYSAHRSYCSKRDKILTAGGFYTIVSNFGKVSSRLVEKHLSNLNKTGYMLDTDETVTKEGLVGELLYLTGLTYFYESDFLSDVMSCPSIRWYRLSPSQVITSLDVALGTWCYENGTIAKIELEPKGMSIDFTHETIFAVGTGDRGKKAFMLSTGMLGSCLEHEIFELLYNIESVSTMKILELANNRDIRIYTITQENIGNALPALQLPDYVKNKIKDDVNAGQIVVVPEKEIQIKSWDGTGWASIDPETGSGRYVISGGLGGEQKGGTTVDRVTWIPILLEGPMEKIRDCEIIMDIINKFINNPLINVITKFTERNIFNNLRDELVTAKQALMLIGVTKGVSAIGFTMTFLGFPEYGVGLVAVKCIGNSYLPKLGGIIQSKIYSAKPNDMLIIEDGVYIEKIYNETTCTV
jgi:hypothetical protein